MKFNVAGKFSTLKNIAMAALDPAKAGVMVKKVQRRLFDPKGAMPHDQYAAWLQEKAIPMDTFLERYDAQLVTEAQAFVVRLAHHSESILKTIPHDLGGGGGVPLLYIVTRLKKPGVVVETGVAAGFSSASFLAALEENGSGHLYSSDFPYFRIEDPEKYIGVVVPQDLKQRWSLLTKGDAANIPRILAQIGKLDIVHYDSDKSYAGRHAVVGQLWDQMNPSAVFIMDDIQDNAYFYDLITEKRCTDYSVISYENKYIGYIQL